ncbi:Ger(x)C family spore germination protein [Psychrobacillus vulpis]|uniref:Ger(X)C family spore germination protein n=1 Tax=Psychrobacillus vulpis TaxID=2325572 RepID=A0A544TTA6_9BACI|nr:Ger(x)C family spore germination protein [Psychrobacillus vulpis]TQR20686.1 Ger(x)C family spore germination protein [Psychrobacillus vulpis]
MKKIVSIVFIVLLLSGCWDERPNKDIAIVPMIGFDGEIGELKGYFGIPGQQQNAGEFSFLKAEGASVEEVRQKIDLQVSEGVDLSKLSSILISDQLAEHDLYSLLDMYYRNARNRLNTSMLITEGSAEPFIKYGEKMGGNVNNYYSQLVKGFVQKSIFPDIDLQLACSYLLDEGIDLVLPYIKISNENDVPEVGGLALFDEGNFTGKTLKREESILLNVMMDKIGKYAYITYMDKNVPVTINIKQINKDMKWDGTTIHIDYKIKIGIMEYYKNDFQNKERKKELEKFLQQKLTTDMEKIVKILHDANSDALGLGRIARAFHQDLFEEGKWKDIYPTLTIVPKVSINITDTGVMD